MTPNADGYEWIARNMEFDHDAILIGQQGAATPEQGVGMMVNRQLVINSELPAVNESALDDSYGEQMSLLDAAVKERYATTDTYAFVMDFDREAAIVRAGERVFKVRFFRAIGAASGSPVFVLANEPLVQLVEPSLAIIIDRLPQARKRIASAQRALAEAVAGRDSEAARSWMRRHIEDFRRGFELAGLPIETVVGRSM